MNAACFKCKRNKVVECPSCEAGKRAHIAASCRARKENSERVFVVNVKRCEYRKSPLYHFRIAGRYLKRALAQAKAAGADIHFQSELSHLISTANHNIEDLKRNY